MAAEALASGANFEITCNEGVVRCSVINREGVTPEEGARCALQMRQFLTTRVLLPGSEYLGLVFDVRAGPPAFGPKTRAALEELFRVAERGRVPLAVRVSESAIQKLQFQSLCSGYAPTNGKVFGDDRDEEWVRQRAGEKGRPAH